VQANSAAGGNGAFRNLRKAIGIARLCLSNAEKYMGKEKIQKTQQPPQHRERRKDGAMGAVVFVAAAGTAATNQREIIRKEKKMVKEEKQQKSDEANISLTPKSIRFLTTRL